MFVDAKTLRLVDFRLVGTAANAAGKEGLGSEAPVGVMAQAPAMLALFDEGKGVKLDRATRASKQIDREFGKGGAARTIFILES